MNNKKAIISSVVSLAAAKAVWTELGREFRYGDELSGKVGVITNIGRLGIRFTASYLGYLFTDTVVKSTLDAISEKIREKTETEETGTFEEDEVKEAEEDENGESL